ncbi:protein phosphatase [Rheinheimera sp. KL1]|uniref:phosphatase domain-containing putative toxin n=1 Tax=Rheinheimera sp. KL1 TaxID=1635005 RepID=UPI0006A9489A|nr:tyrosine-protein phosphatase [Rheinheimera sp. KL1]KOO58831.1 protein phosphatase [Rheinheimera sp. KL1]
MSNPFDELVLEGSAALLFTPCPGTKTEALKDALLTLKQAGASAILTLMPREEMELNQVTDLPALCEELGLAWFHCPIEDDHAPRADFATAWQQQGRQIHQLLKEGKKIAIHCKGGSGRTGLVAAQILLERGIDKERVKQRIQALRPNALTLAPHQAYFQSLS